MSSTLCPFLFLSLRLPFHPLRYSLLLPSVSVAPAIASVVWQCVHSQQPKWSTRVTEALTWTSECRCDFSECFLLLRPGGVKRHIWTFSCQWKIVTVVIKTPKVKLWFIECAALPRLPGATLGYMTCPFLLSRTRPCKWIKHVKQEQVFPWKPYPFHDNPFLDIQWTYHSV